MFFAILIVPFNNVCGIDKDIIAMFHTTVFALIISVFCISITASYFIDIYSSILLYWHLTLCFSTVIIIGGMSLVVNKSNSKSTRYCPIITILICSSLPSYKRHTILERICIHIIKWNFLNPFRVDISPFAIFLYSSKSFREMPYITILYFYFHSTVWVSEPPLAMFAYRY